VQSQGFKFDEIGYWSEIKLDIIRKYASEYSKILAAQSAPRFYHVYVDAFAGAGFHLSETTGQFVQGSPLNALAIEPPFREYHFIDLDRDKAENLRKLTTARTGVYVHVGDCNEILLDQVFPQLQYKQYRRALCLLDPYGLHLDWSVIQRAGELKTIELFLNFPVMDMNRNVLWRHPKGVAPEDVARMNAFWGDESWRQAAYVEERTLFGTEEKKTDNEDVAEAFQKRLRTAGRFKYVPEPLPMRNSRGATIYYLFFAAHKPVASYIVDYIFNTYRGRLT
jgi:three-Cys-motif partner protein